MTVSELARLAGITADTVRLRLQAGTIVCLARRGCFPKIGGAGDGESRSPRRRGQLPYPGARRRGRTSGGGRGNRLSGFPVGLRHALRDRLRSAGGAQPAARQGLRPALAARTGSADVELHGQPGDLRHAGQSRLPLDTAQKPDATLGCAPRPALDLSAGADQAPAAALGASPLSLPAPGCELRPCELQLRVVSPR